MVFETEDVKNDLALQRWERGFRDLYRLDREGHDGNKGNQNTAHLWHQPKILSRKFP